jgi:Icc-related predicted phosphoesterase
MKNQIEKKIAEAQKFAQVEYVKFMKKINAHNPKYKREWREIKTLPDKSKRYFALTGTPDKAFVIAELKTGEVKAYNQAQQLLKTFK